MADDETTNEQAEEQAEERPKRRSRKPLRIGGPPGGVSAQNGKILVIGLGIAAMHTVVSFKTGDGMPKPRAYVAAGLVTAGMFAVAQWNPKLAVGLGALAFVGMALRKPPGQKTSFAQIFLEGLPNVGKKEGPEPGSWGESAARPAGFSSSTAGGASTAPGYTPVSPNLRGLIPPVSGSTTIIGRPNQGTHTRGNWQSDNAVDFGAAMGAPVLAVETGTIGSSFGFSGIGGNRLTLLGASGNEYYYAHLQRYATGIHAGSIVRPGQVIGYVGDTGNARGTTPHLHFGVKQGNAEDWILN